MRPAASAADFHAERYSDENLSFWVPLLVEVGAVEAGHRVLDVGCGTGGFTAAIAESSNAEVVGCDHSPTLLEHARRTSAAAEWVEAGAERLPFTDESFDRVLMSLLLHQVDEPAQAIAEAFRVLRRPGTLVVRTVLPHDAAARVPFRFFPTLARVQAGQMPSLEELTEWVRAAGFDRIWSRRVLRNKRLELDAVEAQLQRYPFLRKDELDDGLRRMRESWDGRPDPRPAIFVLAEKH